MSTSTAVAGTAAPAADRLTRGRLLGRPGRARELLGLLDQEQPEQDLRPLDDRDGWWRRSKTNTTRQRAECHPERPMHAKRLCRSCYTRAWYAEHPEALARDRARIEAVRRERVRAKWGLPPDAPDDEVKRVANRVGSLDMWRKRKAAAIRRARSVDWSRASNWKPLRQDLGARVPWEWNTEEDLDNR